METKYITVSIANTNSHIKKLRTCATIAAFLLMLAATLLFPASAQSEQAGNRPLSEQKPAVAPEPKDALTDIEQRPVEILQLPDDSEQDPAPVAVILFDVPEADTGFKAYMDFRSIKDRTTAQYRLQQEAWTDEQGFRRLLAPSTASSVGACSASLWNREQALKLLSRTSRQMPTRTRCTSTTTGMSWSSSSIPLKYRRIAELWET